MQWTVEQLKRWKNARFVVEDVVKVNDLKDRDREIRDISPVHVQGEATINDDLASFHLHLTGKLVLPCSLTLEDVDYPFSINTIETFQFEPSSSHKETAENEEVHQLEGHIVDLMPVIKENILVAIPMKVVGENAEAKASGEGWEIVSENEQKNRIDPRMAKLAKLLDKHEDEQKD